MWLFIIGYVIGYYITGFMFVRNKDGYLSKEDRSWCLVFSVLWPLVLLVTIFIQLKYLNPYYVYLIFAHYKQHIRLPRFIRNKIASVENKLKA